MPGRRLINYRELKHQCETLGTTATAIHLQEAIEKKDLSPDDFSVRELAEAFCGTAWVDSLRPKSGRRILVESPQVNLQEAVSYSDFSQITGQIIFSKVQEGYADEEFVFQKEIPAVKSDIQDMEKIPGLSNIGDDSAVVLEGNAYPYVGFSQDAIQIAAKRKRGMIVSLSKEAVLGDKTGQLLEHARRVGFYQGLELEKRVCDAIVDENGGAVSAALGGHRYYWYQSGGYTSYATYQTTTPWDNVTTSNALVDWTDIEGANLTLRAITDPYTGEPVMITPTHVIVTPQLEWTAKRCLSATDVRTHSGGYATSGNLVDFGGPNPIPWSLKLLTSQMLATRMVTDTDWYLGDLRKLVNRFVNWDIETEEAGPNHPAAFERDIALQVKVSVKDVVSVVEPRAMNESRA